MDTKDIISQTEYQDSMWYEKDFKEIIVSILVAVVLIVIIVIVSKNSSLKKEIPEVKQEIPEVKQEIPEVKQEIPEVKQEIPEVKQEIPEVKQEIPEELNGDQRDVYMEILNIKTFIKTYVIPCINQCKKNEQKYEINFLKNNIDSATDKKDQNDNLKFSEEINSVIKKFEIYLGDESRSNTYTLRNLQKLGIMYVFSLTQNITTYIKNMSTFMIREKCFENSCILYLFSSKIYSKESKIILIDLALEILDLVAQVNQALLQKVLDEKDKKQLDNLIKLRDNEISINNKVKSLVLEY